MFDYVNTLTVSWNIRIDNDNSENGDLKYFVVLFVLFKYGVNMSSPVTASLRLLSFYQIN